MSKFHILPLDFGNPIVLMIYSRNIEHSRIRPLFSLARLRVLETSFILQVYGLVGSAIMCVCVHARATFLPCHQTKIIVAFSTFISPFWKVKPPNADPSGRAV